MPDDQQSVADSKKLKRPSKRPRPNKFAALGGSLANPSFNKLLQSTTTDAADDAQMAATDQDQAKLADNWKKLLHKE